MALLAGGELDDAVLVDVVQRHQPCLLLDHGVVDARAAALDQAARLAVARRQARQFEEFEGGHAGGQFGLAKLDRRQRLAGASLFEGPTRRLARLASRLGAMGKRRRLIGQHLLGLVDFVALEGLEAGDLVRRQLGEQAQEPADIGIGGVAPILPVLVGRELLFGQPHRAPRRLPHLLAAGGRDQRRGQTEQGQVLGPAPELDAVDDVAPLIRPAHLQPATVTPGQLDEVVSLQHHVIEFEEGEGLVSVEAQFDRFEPQHAVDREMPAVVAQERNVAEFVEPVGVVHHDGVAGAIAEGKEIGENLLDARHVPGDLGIGQKLAVFFLARGIADLGRARAHEHDRLMAGVL